MPKPPRGKFGKILFPHCISPLGVCSRIYFFLCAIWSGAWPNLNVRRLIVWNRSKKVLKKSLISCSGTAYFAKCSPNVRQMVAKFRQMFSKIYLYLFQKHIKYKKLFCSRNGSPWEMGGCTARHFAGNFGAVLFRGVPGPPKKQPFFMGLGPVLGPI